MSLMDARRGLHVVSLMDARRGLHVVTTGVRVRQTSALRCGIRPVTMYLTRLASMVMIVDNMLPMVYRGSYSVCSLCHVTRPCEIAVDVVWPIQ